VVVASQRVTAADFDQTQLTDIAGQRRLSCPHPLRSEQRRKLFLTAHFAAANPFQDVSLPRFLLIMLCSYICIPIDNYTDKRRKHKMIHLRRCVFRRHHGLTFRVLRPAGNTRERP